MIIFAKNSIVDVLQGTRYVSRLNHVFSVVKVIAWCCETVLYFSFTREKKVHSTVSSNYGKEIQPIIINKYIIQLTFDWSSNLWNSDIFISLVNHISWTLYNSSMITVPQYSISWHIIHSRSSEYLKLEMIFEATSYKKTDR